MMNEYIPGDLRAYKDAEPGTMLHFDQVSAAQVHNHSLRLRSVYTADGPLYSMDGSHPVLDLTRHTLEGPNNLVLVHLFDEKDSSYKQLRDTGNFRPDLEEAKRVMEAVSTLRIPLEELRLQGNDNVYRSLCVRTADGMILVGEDDAIEPNRYEELLLDRAGVTPAFRAALQEKPYSIRETRVFVLSPDYVEQEAAQSVIGRAAWRGDFGSLGSNASGRVVGLHLGLLGVRRVGREAAAPELGEVPKFPQAATEISPERCYEVLLADPEGAAAALDGNTAAGLTRIIADYLAARGQ